MSSERVWQRGRPSRRQSKTTLRTLTPGIPQRPRSLWLRPLQGGEVMLLSSPCLQLLGKWRLIFSLWADSRCEVTPKQQSQVTQHDQSAKASAVTLGDAQPIEPGQHAREAHFFACKHLLQFFSCASVAQRLQEMYAAPCLIQREQAMLFLVLLPK